MAKKVYVPPYEKPTTGQRVKGYVRTDPRDKKEIPKELPQEGEKPSFLSEGIEEENSEESNEESREGE